MVWSALVEQMDRALLDRVGQDVVYRVGGVGAPQTVTGIFDAAYVRVEAGQPGVSSQQPAVFLRLADLPSDPEVDQPTLTIAGVVYRVVEAQKDGQGGVRLFLHEA